MIDAGVIVSVICNTAGVTVVVCDSLDLCLVR